MALRSRSPLPSFAGATRWLGDEPNPDALVGRPVLVHFWSISCYVCHDVAERVAAWREKFGAQGLAVIAIHQPRSQDELDLAKVEADARGPMALAHPCAIDNDHTIVDRFENQFVPAYYVFDRDHLLRTRQAGDKGFDRVEAELERVVAEHVAATNPAGVV